MDSIRKRSKRKRVAEHSEEICVQEKFDTSSSIIIDFQSMHHKFNEIIKKKWKLYSATPLWNISYEDVRKGYSNENLIKDILEVSSIHKKTLSVQFLILNDLLTDTPPLQIRISGTTKSNQSKLIYDGVFIAYSNKRNNSTMHLPILLCSGRISFINLIHPILMRYFDCSISEIQFTQQDLKWLAALATNCSKNSNIVSWVYTNVHGKRRNTFDHSIPFHCLSSIWACIHEEDSSVITYEEVTKFHTALEEHWYHSLMLDMAKLHLKTIVFPNEVSIDVTGKIHMSNVKIMDVIFRFLNYLLPSNDY